MSWRPERLKPCGTIAAYKRHERHGEQIDELCRAANVAKTGAYVDANREAVNARRRRRYREKAAMKEAAAMHEPGDALLAARLVARYALGPDDRELLAAVLGLPVSTSLRLAS